MRWELRLAISTRLRADKGLKMNRPRILLTAMLMLALCACQRSPAPSATAAPAAAPSALPDQAASASAPFDRPSSTPSITASVRAS